MTNVAESPVPMRQEQLVVQDESPRPVRIAHVQLLPLLSGVQRVALDELIRLDRRRYEPYLICKSPGPLTEAAEACGVRCLYADRLVRPISPWSDLRALWQLHRLMREHRFHVVHTHSSKTGILGRLAARAAGVPCIVHTVHGFAFASTSSWIKKAIYFGMEWLGARLCDALVCLNHTDLDFARKWLRLPADRLCRIPNGIDSREYQPAGHLQRAAIRRDVLGLQAGELAVGMVARLSAQKDPLCFVESADLVLSRGVSARFYLVGDGELRAAVEAEIARRGRAGRIVVLGWRDRLPGLIGSMDLFVLPSLWEGYSLAILEALACGVPVIASDIPGNREAVTEGFDGLLVPCGRAEEFADAILSLLSNSPLRHQFGRAGRQIVTTRHDLDARVARVEQLYAEIVGSEAGVRAFTPPGLPARRASGRCEAIERNW